MSQNIPSSSNLSTTTAATASVAAALPARYSVIAAELRQFETSLSSPTLSTDERNSLRRRGEYPQEVMVACCEMAADPACAGMRIELRREEVDAKLERIAEAKRLVRVLRRLARHASDDALIKQGEIATDTMQALDMLDIVASRPGGEHLRARVDEARSLVRRERAPRRRNVKKEEIAPPVVVAPKG